MSIILNPLAWAVILGVAYGAVSQLYYLNHSLRHFDAAQIGSFKYVGTNALVVIGSVILFDEFASITTRYNSDLTLARTVANLVTRSGSSWD